MKRLILYNTLLSCVFFIISCSPVSQKQYEKRGQTPLTVTQLEKMLKGTIVHLETIDFDSFVSFHDNMSLTATSHNGDTDSGTWSLVEDDNLCLKFRFWYLGDNKCYRVIDDKNNLIFFTPNGALSYIGIVAQQDSSVKDTVPEKVDTVFPTEQLQEVITSTGNSSEPAKDRFARLAKNCPDCNLSGVDLSNTQLNYANLAGANLSGADLTDADLRQANLMGANLTNAKLIRANLPGANLSFADLSNANLSGSNLIRANVTNATFNNTNLTEAHLESIQGKIQ